MCVTCASSVGVRWATSVKASHSQPWRNQTRRELETNDQAMGVLPPRLLRRHHLNAAGTSVECTCAHAPRNRFSRRPPLFADVLPVPPRKAHQAVSIARMPQHRIAQLPVSCCRLVQGNGNACAALKIHGWRAASATRRLDHMHAQHIHKKQAGLRAPSCRQSLWRRQGILHREGQSSCRSRTVAGEVLQGRCTRAMPIAQMVAMGDGMAC